MEREGRTVIVCGVPTDIDEKRLTDKLCIHFLRKRHGGGEISSVTLPKSMQGCALITFEDSEVSQRVIQYGKHILCVDDKKFELTVSLFCKEVDPDEVFLCLAVTVDYNRLPMGKLALSSLQQSFPDVQFSFMPEEESCNIKGRYSEVQVLISHLLNLIEPQASVATRPPEGTKDRVDALLPREKNGSTSGPVYHSKSNERQKDSGYVGQALRQDLKSSDYSERSHHSDQALENNRGVEDGAASLLQEAPLEEYILVMDSDIYRYLQQHCGEDYQQILSQHKVEAVDLCTQDITTVFLQAKTGYPGQEVKRLQRVHEDLGWLYQQTEAQLRKEQLPKGGISTEDLQQAFKALQQRLPKILLSNDKMNIYIVGSGSDVSEAKQFFLDLQGTEGGSTLGRAGYTRPLISNESNSLFLPSSSASTPVSTGSIIDSREADTVHKPYRKPKIEAGKEYKLAARFMETGSKPTGKNEMGFFMGDTTAPGDTQKDLLFATSKKTSDSGCRLGTGPMLGSGSLDVREYSLKDNQGQNQTGNDLLFGRPGPQLTTSKEGKYLSNVVSTSALLPSKPMQFSNTQSTAQHMEYGNKVAQTAEIPSSGLTSQSKLRRTNSFSGKVRATQDLKDSTTREGSQEKTNRSKTSSSRNSIADTLEVYSVEVVVPPTIWMYMKACYRAEIANLTTGLHVKECKSESSVTVYLRGADTPTVGLCQRELRNLISKVTADFRTQELSMAELGVTNPKDATLELRCMELRNKFEKIMILPLSENIFIIGPYQLCEQVMTKLIEVFHNGTQRKKEMEENLDGSSPNSLLFQNKPQIPPETASGGHNLLKDDITKTTGLMSVDSPQYSRNSQMDSELEFSNRSKDYLQEKDSSQKEVKQDFGTTMEGGNQSAEQKDPGFKHLKWNMSRENFQFDTSLTQPTEAAWRVPVPKDSGSTSLPNFGYTIDTKSNPKLHNITTQERHISPGPDGLEIPEGKDPKDQSASLSGKMPGKNKTQEDSLSCPCGTSRSSISRMACGNTYCPQCVCDHASCKVCPKAENVRGIKGTMSVAELNMSLSGHLKDTTLKLTYSIPDGIQGEDHPNPGATFKGGVFEAFLPLNRQTRRLLPLLKRAFNEGLTFTITEGNQGERVIWGIPHKTKMEGGKSVNGYPDSAYLSRLTKALELLGIEEDKDHAKVQDKIKS
ncbi:uncharacterized protein LOC133122398 [Conger conger]|uniref:uncharacterized protein LOC133122398 n=1 Tax=Conger conger TaxID=82655 RepID=UPI002A59BF30|nr:uncharacterized protein LOC133122398 [Conger conger]XP_061088340.1 uncharacterized protein LOC133122398 [Conger conger]